MAAEVKLPTSYFALAENVRRIAAFFQSRCKVAKLKFQLCALSLTHTLRHAYTGGAVKALSAREL